MGGDVGIYSEAKEQYCIYSAIQLAAALHWNGGVTINEICMSLFIIKSYLLTGYVN